MLGGQDGKFKNEGNAASASFFFGNTCVSAIVLVAAEEGGETLDSRHGGGGNLFWDSSQTSFFPFRPDTEMTAPKRLTHTFPRVLFK